MCNPGHVLHSRERRDQYVSLKAIEEEAIIKEYCENIRDKASMKVITSGLLFGSSRQFS